MSSHDAGVIILALLFTAITAFILGWGAAESRERHAKVILEGYIQYLNQQVKDLASWAEQNWPDQYHAYLRGHTEGYQQGVLHSPTLEEDNS